MEFLRCELDLLAVLGVIPSPAGSLNRPARGAISGLSPACGVLVPVNKQMSRAFSWGVTVCRGFN